MNRRTLFGAAGVFIPSLATAQFSTESEYGRHQNRIIQEQEIRNALLQASEQVYQLPHKGELDRSAILNLATGALLPLSAGVYDLYETLELGDGTPFKNSSTASLSLIGCGAGANEGEMNTDAGTIIRWRGPDGMPAIRLNGPIYGCTMKGFTIECNGRSNGIEANHPVNCTFSDISIRSPKTYGFKLWSTAAARSGMAVGAGGNKVSHVRVFQPFKSTGFHLGADSTYSVGSSGNIFEQCSALGGGIGWKLRFTDYITLNMCQSLYASSSMVVEAPTGQWGQYFPTAVFANNWAADYAPIGLPGWTPAPNTGIVFTQYHREWNGGNPKDLINSFGPQFPTDNRFSGTDVLGVNYPMYR